jgi:isopentenyldiphosphate isomerase
MVKNAQGLREPAGLKPSDMEVFEVCDIAGVTVAKVRAWQAHKLGIPHRSVDIIIVTSNNKVILQQRSSDRYVFPNKWAISVGGHITSQAGNKVMADPRDAALHELEGELGLKIADKRRLKPVNADGIGEFLIASEYRTRDLVAVFYQFDRAAKNIGIEIKKGSVTAGEKDGLIDSFRSNELDARMFYWNEELNYCYLLKISDEEAKNISYKDGEVNGHREFTIREMIDMGNDMDRCSDTFFSLIRLRPDIADHLERLAANPQ